MDLDILISLSRASANTIGAIGKRDDAIGAVVRGLSAKTATSTAQSILMSGSAALKEFVLLSSTQK